MPKGKTPRRPHDQRLAHIQYITHRVLQGATVPTIVQELHAQGDTHVTYMMVYKDLSRLRRDWQQATAANYTEIRNRELAKIDLLEQTYWEAWQRSRQPAEKRQSKRVIESPQPQPPGQPGNQQLITNQKDEAGVQTQHRDGNPFFLAGVQWCIETRTKMLGIEAPTEMDKSMAVGRPLIPIEILQSRRQQKIRADKALAQLGRGPMVQDAIEGEARDVTSADR